MAFKLSEDQWSFPYQCNSTNYCPYFIPCGGGQISTNGNVYCNKDDAPHL